MNSTQVSLYLDLEPGQAADLEVVARASLAWAAAIRELAFIVDPSMEIRIELSSGTQGSLSLNAVLKNLKNKNGEVITLKAIALIIVAWFGVHTADYAFEKLADLIANSFGNEEAFTPEQRRELEDIIAKSVGSRIADKHVQQVYREVERDPAVTGIGATTEPGQRPDVIVPRADFQARSGHPGAVVEQIVNRRIITEKVRVGLISPILLPGNRRWKLRSAQGEFGAAIRDQNFIKSVLLGTTSIRMKAGIEMDIDLETTEEFKNGVWEVVERNVLHVDNLIEPPSQTRLFPPGADDDQPGDDDR